MVTWIRLAACAACLAGCTVNVVGTTSTGTGGSTASNTPVTFSVAVDPNAFSDKRQINVTIWDAEQLALADASAGCSVSHDAATGKDTTTCPPGVTYKPATPETIATTKEELAKGLTVTSKSVTVGERYRVSVSGMASDDCNTASATAEGTASAAAVKLSGLQVAQTEMACVPTR